VEDPSVTADRYDRTSLFYDLYDLPMDLLGGVRRRRQRLLARAYGRVVEVGVGTGRNLDLYPAGVQIVGIDISPGMLDQAQRHAHTIGVDEVTLLWSPLSRWVDLVTATCGHPSAPHAPGGTPPR
jgi:ubiquinone/menaquinone biosynthesis C-methylase UbiE